MGLFTSTEFNSLDDLLIEQLQDLYDAEHRQLDGLPGMVEAAESPELEYEFRKHLAETRQQVTRLEEVFSLLDQSPSRESCEAMKGLVKESEKITGAKGDASIKDAALIAAAQRIEHYEMAGYGSARNFAKRCGQGQVAELLQETLDEEGAADSKLTEIAEQSVNSEAASASQSTV